MYAKVNVAIDGPAGAGKSTVAKLVASHLGLRYLDTGAMYRATTCLALKLRLNLDSETELVELARKLDFGLDSNSRITLDGQAMGDEIRTPEVNRHVSKVSSYSLVRQVIVAKQRFIALAGGIVMDGRDIGTTVMVDAPVKVFLTADIAERARRRQAELRESGHQVELSELTEQLRQRDYLDSTRSASPLRPANDAVIVDTTELSLDDVVERVLAIVRSVVED